MKNFILILVASFLCASALADGYGYNPNGFGGGAVNGITNGGPAMFSQITLTNPAQNGAVVTITSGIGGGVDPSGNPFFYGSGDIVTVGNFYSVNGSYYGNGDPLTDLNISSNNVTGQINPNQIYPLIVATSTNGLATTNYVNASTNGFVGASVTNGLATTNYVNSSIITATNNLTGSNAPSSAFTGLSFTGSFYGNGGSLTNLAGLINGWVNQQNFSSPRIQRSSLEVVTNIPNLTWPDGALGSFLTTSNNPLFNTIDSYTCTYTNGPIAHGYTQPTILRDSNGAATNVPAIVQNY